MVPVIAAALSNDEVGKTIQYVAMGGLSLAVVVGGVWVAKKAVSDMQKDKDAQKSLDGGNAEYFARLLGKALYTNDWWGRITFGIDEGVVYSTLESIPRGMMNQVAKSFSTQFDITLAEELKDKFWLSEYQKALAIIQTKY